MSTDTPHYAYIQACASALTAAGMPVETWYADEGDLLDAGITLDSGRCLAWSEERAWYALTSDGGNVIDSLGAFAPPPAGVAAWAAAIPARPRVIEAPRFRSAEDEDDALRAEILADLAEYRGETSDA
ncbi:DUF6292 family protein [Actinoalloteichus sp. GBA129-24]|uniref:DUF6292 family protein n=1 Tax=Actinoalloteichus sp. GBA129-24 TaxID=1612551 RepID=UPI0009509591|nr:DUF6292 family protein [Actinoalloteichus sp. GBA129-24]APU20921.1 hypothetical protein UA75_14555 [Actinoalloteichus sp. GBA129-24]APU24170.1 hypothetical protein UA75_31035 [Actinoalloteichus sp. GBA129-24]